MIQRIRRALRMFKFYRSFGYGIVFAARRAWWMAS